MANHLKDSAGKIKEKVDKDKLREHLNNFKNYLKDRHDSQKIQLAEQFDPKTEIRIPLKGFNNDKLQEVLKKLK